MFACIKSSLLPTAHKYVSHQHWLESNSLRRNALVHLLPKYHATTSTMSSREEQEDGISPANKEAHIASAMNRLASPDFPTELLLQVVEIAVVSQVNHWNVADSHTLDALATSLFAWPKGVTATTRGLLKQTAETAILKRCIVRIPADLDERRPPAYEIPPALLGRSSHVKHLVLNLEVHIGFFFSRELIVSTGHMDLLAEAFPRLAVCTYLLHIDFDSFIVPPGGFIDVSILSHADFRSEKPTTPPASDEISMCTVEDNLVDFIAAFARWGPGRRKLICFTRRKTHFLPSRILNLHSEFRPLAKVSSPHGSSTAGAVDNGFADEGKESLINARRILEEAYPGLWEHR